MADTDQTIGIPVPASPLTARAIPDTYLLTQMQLARSYLQTRDVSYLGHAIRMLRPLGGRICAKLGLDGYDEMIATDPQVAQGIDILYMALSSNTLSFGVTENTGNDEAAQGALSFIREVHGQMDCDFDEERARIAYDLIRYGNAFGEIEYKQGEGELKGHLTIKEVHAVDPKDVVIITDSYNRIIGYAPYGFPGVTAPLDSWVPADSFISYMFDAFDSQQRRDGFINDVEILPKWKVWHPRWQPTASDPRGKALLEPALHPWWAKQQMMSVLLLLVEEWGTPRKVGKLAEKSDSVCLYDAAGRPITDPQTGMPAMRDALPALLEVLQNSAGGGSIALPYGYSLDVLEADPAMLEAILKAIEFFNTEISKAVLKQHLASDEGKRGSEKGVATHGDILSLLIIHGKSTIARTLQQQVFKPIIGANFGKINSHFTPTVDVGDGDGLPLTLLEVGVLQQAGYFSPDQLPKLDRRVGVPVRKEMTPEMEKARSEFQDRMRGPQDALAK